MRILLFHRDLPPETLTGVAIQVHRLANALVQLGEDVTVLTHSEKPPDALYPVLTLPLPRRWRSASGPGPIPSGRGRPAIRPGRKSLYDLAFPWNLLRPGRRLLLPLAYRFASALRSREFDIVHAHGDGAFFPRRGGLVRTFHGTAALEARHAKSLKGWLAQSLSHALEEREAGRMGLCVAVSAHVKAFLPEVTAVVPNLLAEDPPARCPEKGEALEMVFLGSRASRKNGNLALTVFRELHRIRPEVIFHYVGPAAEALELRAEFAAFPALHFHSRLDDRELQLLFRRCRAYLSLSSYEGFGVPTIEAMSQGCVPVSLPHAGSLEILNHGRNGLLGDPSQLLPLLLRLFGHEEWRAGLAREAWKQSWKYAPGMVGMRYVQLYRHLLDKERV